VLRERKNVRAEEELVEEDKDVVEVFDRPFMSFGLSLRLDYGAPGKCLWGTEASLKQVHMGNSGGLFA
jgi:hypothetical protein